MSGIVFCPYNQNGCLGVNKPIILPTIQCAGDRQIDSWFLTPSQPWRLYQGELCAWEKAKSIWGIKSASHLSPNLLPPTQCVWEIQPDLMYKISEPFKPESPTYHSVCRGENNLTPCIKSANHVNLNLLPTIWCAGRKNNSIWCMKSVGHVNRNPEFEVFTHPFTCWTKYF